MRFLLDENVGTTLGNILVANGHDSVRVAQVMPASDDRAVLQFARENDRVLVTYDSDFGELVFARGEAAPPAIVYFRIDPSDQQMAAFQLLSLSEAGTLTGHLTVIDWQTVRRRAFPHEAKND